MKRRRPHHKPLQHKCFLCYKKWTYEFFCKECLARILAKGKPEV